MSDTITRPFAVGDPSSINKYCELMNNFDDASYDSPLREGSTFDLALVEPTPFDRVPARNVPRLPFSTTATFTLCRPLQRGRNYRSQVWVVKVVPRGSEVGDAELVLKFIIPSQQSLPWEEMTHNDITWASYFFPEDIVAYQAAAYNALAKHQGGTVPYFYGAHKITAPWGEPVSVLALEYIHGPCLWEMRAALDSDAPHNTAFMEYQDYERYLSLFQSAMKTITDAHDVDIQHCDIRDAHILVDIAHNRVVIIDWTNDAPDHLAHTGLSNDPCRARFYDMLEVCVRFLRCERHEDKLFEYIYATYPVLHSFWPNA